MQLALPFAPTGSPIAPVSIGLEPLGSMIAPPSAGLSPTGSVIAPTSIGPAPTGSTYYVRHTRARRYVLRVDPDGRLRVTIPRGGSRRAADAFVQAQLEWVARQRARLPRQAPISEERRQELRQLRERAARELPPRLLELAERHGLGVSRVSVRNQRSRWGSCGRDGHICLNWRLLLMPSWVSDYVLIHELMHLRRMDHSPAYWRLVAAACPDYRAARIWLRTHGSGLR